MRRSSAASLGLAALIAATAAPTARAADPAPVVAAERAFAADGLALGIKRSFLKHAVPDALLFAPDPTTVTAVYGTRPDGPSPPLVWWPVHAGLAASGDLGFTTGPATYDGKPSGWYFTVWKRQADGGWKWVYDGGAPSATAGAPGPESVPSALAPASGPAVSQAEAWAKVQAAEAALAQAATLDAQAAYAAALAPDARVAGSPAPPAATPDAVRAEIAGRATRLDFAPRGGEASGAGDLAWTWGAVRWTEAAGDRQAWYVRIWRRDAEGWRIVYDQILPARA